MKRALLILSSIVALSVGCGPLGGSCPDPDELTELPVLSGDYADPTVWEYGEVDRFDGAANMQLVVDRDAGTATLSFTNPQGQLVEIAYQATSEEWGFQ